MAGKTGALQQMLEYIQRARATGEDKAAQAAVQHLAKGLYADVPSLDVYHGSPHVWDEPAFIDNLKSGEGALAFGPGGYTTGYRSLAAEYARNLAARANGTGDDFAKHGPSWIAQLRAMDPSDSVLANFMMHRGADRVSRFAYPSVVSTPGYKAAQELMAQVTPEMRALLDKKKLREGRTGEIYNAAQPTDAQVRFAKDAAPELAEVSRLARLAVAPGWGGRLGPDMTLQINARNAANSAAFLADPSTPRSLRLDMKATGVKLGAPPRDDPRTFMGPRRTIQPNIYNLSLQTNPADTLPLDYPVSSASPRLLGALELLHRAANQTLDPRLPGRDVMSNLGLMHPDNPALAAQVLRESGIPALNYLRGGRRNFDEVPTTFNPEDYNFVTFDDSVLKLKSRANKAHGGSV